MAAVVKRGARHSKKDLAMLKEIKEHAATIGEHAVSLGAEDTETTDEGEEGKSMGDTVVDAAVAVKYQPHPYPIKVVKADDDTLTVGGYGVVFGGKDLMGDTFTAATDFWLSVMKGDMPRPVLYDHGFDDAVKLFVLGQTVKIEPDEVGLWVEAQLERHNRYMREVEQLIEMGVLGYSSGSVGHLVRYAESEDGDDDDDWFWGGGTFASWPLFEFSLTPTPAEPRTLGVGQIRSLVQAYPAAKSLLTPLKTAGARGRGLGAGVQSVAVPATPSQLKGVETVATPQVSVSTPIDGGHNQVLEDEEMNEQQVAAIVEAAIAKALPGVVDAAVQSFRVSLEGEQPLKTVGVASSRVSVGSKKDLTPQRAFKIWTMYGNDAPDEVLRVIKAGPIVGIDMDGGDETKTLVEGVEGQGGAWVPQLMANEVITPLADLSYLRRAKARILTLTGTDSFEVPKLTFSGAATIGPEGSPYVPNEPGADNVEFKPYKLKKLAKATEELVDDSRFDVWGNILQPDYEQAFAAGENTYLTTGSGTGQPQGVVTGATLGLTLANGTGQTTTITSFDSIIKLYHKLDYKYREDPSCAWMMSDAMLEIVSTLKDGTGKYVLTQGVDGQPDRIKGKPVITNNSMAAPGVSADTILFGAFRYYWIGDWQGLQIQKLMELYSETGHVGFRAYRRIDGHVMQAAAFTKLRMAAS